MLQSMYGDSPLKERLLEATKIKDIALDLPRLGDLGFLPIRPIPIKRNHGTLFAKRFYP